MQAFEIGGASVACVRIEGTEADTSTCDPGDCDRRQRERG
jgi:hypothetical protein